jgi:hypothetical protein
VVGCCEQQTTEVGKSEEGERLMKASQNLPAFSSGDTVEAVE